MTGERGCTCDDWMELSLARKEDGCCGTHGNKEPCGDCEEYRRRDAADPNRWPA